MIIMQADSVFQAFKSVTLKNDSSKEKLGAGRAIPTISNVLELGEAPILIPAGIRLY